MLKNSEYMQEGYYDIECREERGHDASANYLSYMNFSSPDQVGLRRQGWWPMEVTIRN